jgi:hypothetical protein
MKTRLFLIMLLFASFSYSQTNDIIVNGNYFVKKFLQKFLIKII